MYKLITICACIIVVLIFVSVRSDYGSEAEHVGQMPTIVVTAARHNIESEWLGLTDTVVVTASRYDEADVAWSGLLDTVTTIQTPAQPLRGSTTPIMTFQGPLGIITDDYHFRVE